MPLAGGAWADVPAPLPPALDWTPALVSVLSEADPVCAGLYQMDAYYSSQELCPSQLPAQEVRRRILEDAEG